MDLVADIEAWTAATSRRLNDGERVFLQAISVMADADRCSWVLRRTWPAIWADMGQPGDPPPWPGLLEGIVRHGLADRVPEHIMTDFNPMVPPLLDSDPTAAPRPMPVEVHIPEAFEVLPGIVTPVDPDADPPIRISLHRTIAAVVRRDGDPGILQAVGRRLAGFWSGHMSPRLPNWQTGELTLLFIGSAVRMIPYLVRLGWWEDVEELLHEVLRQDDTAATRGRLAQALGSAADAADVPDRQRQFCLDRSAAILDRTDRRPSGRTEPAIGDGPWSRLVAEYEDLFASFRQGRFGEVLDGVDKLAERMDALSDEAATREEIRSTAVRDDVLDLGVKAAIMDQRWERAIALSRRLNDALIAHGATSSTLARHLFDQYGPLLRLDRHDEASKILRRCEDMLEDEEADALQADDHVFRGMLLGARADLVNSHGDHAHALDLQRGALQSLYSGADPVPLVVGHHNLASLLLAQDPPLRQEALHHHLVAAVLSELTGEDPDLPFDPYFGGRAFELHGNGYVPLIAKVLEEMFAVGFPGTWESVTTDVEERDGVRVQDIVRRLSPDDTGAGRRALDGILERAWALLNKHAAPHLASWDPVIAGLVLRYRGGDRNPLLVQELDEAVSGLQRDARWAGMARFLAPFGFTPETAGESPEDHFVHHLVGQRLLDVLDGETEVPPDLWLFIRVRDNLGCVVAGALGDDDLAHQATRWLDDLDRKGDALLGPMARSLRRILAGEHGDDLCVGLEPACAAAVRTVLDHVRGTGPLPISRNAARRFGLIE